MWVIVLLGRVAMLLVGVKDSTAGDRVHLPRDKSGHRAGHIHVHDLQIIFAHALLGKRQLQNDLARGAQLGGHYLTFQVFDRNDTRILAHINFF